MVGWPGRTVQRVIVVDTSVLVEALGAGGAPRRDFRRAIERGHRLVPRPWFSTSGSAVRGREVDLAIAACALGWNARLWTVNPPDFEDVPGLELYG